MSLAHTLLRPEPAGSPTGRRGRVRVDQSPEQRQLHIACASARLLYGKSVADCAAAFDISARTVQLWTAKALGYEGPMADVLRRAQALLN
jgi:hypothetical protein